VIKTDFVAEVFRRITNAPDDRMIMVGSENGSFQKYTYKQIVADVAYVSHGLKGIGVGRDTRVLVLMRPGFDFFSVIVSLLGVGAVPVLIDPGIGIKQMLACIRNADIHAMVVEPRACLLRVLGPGCFPSLKVAVSAGGRAFPFTVPLKKLRRHAGEFRPVPREGDDLCMIAFTSGSTGPAKGVEFTCANMMASMDIFSAMVGEDKGDVDLLCLPALALISIALARSMVLPAVDYANLASVDPAALLSAISQCRVTVSFGSPVVFRNLARHCKMNNIDLSGMRFACSAGAPIALDTVAAFRSLMKGGQFLTPYGATEALPVTSISADEIIDDVAEITANGGGTCVGQPLGPTRIRIIRISDEAMPEWTDGLELERGCIGEIVVSGPQVTKGYFRKDAETRSAKIFETHSDGLRTLWHRMGDAGYFDEKGRLWFCGRLKHIVKHNDCDYYPVCVEGIFNAEPDIWRTALVGFRTNSGSRMALVVEFNENGKPADTRKRKEELMGVAERHSIPLTDILFYAGALPTDRRHNSKIERGQLAEWAKGNSR
jgi:acyl-CoA synthetase (AMP-forming)/AMP-acid ligase II